MTFRATAHLEGGGGGRCSPPKPGVRPPRECGPRECARYLRGCDTRWNPGHLWECAVPSVPKMGPRIRARAAGWRASGGGRGTDRPPHPHHPHPPARDTPPKCLATRHLRPFPRAYIPCIDNADYHYITRIRPVGTVRPRGAPALKRNDINSGFAHHCITRPPAATRAVCVPCPQVPADPCACTRAPPSACPPRC